MATHEWRPSKPCPLCGVDNECATNVDRTNTTSPKPGSVIICYSCGFLALLGNDMRLRAPTAAERQELDHDPMVQRALKVHREGKHRRAH
jgi:hypothetical protein